MRSVCEWSEAIPPPQPPQSSVTTCSADSYTSTTSPPRHETQYLHPTAYNEDDPPAGLPTSPLAPRPDATGFRWAA